MTHLARWLAAALLLLLCAGGVAAQDCRFAARPTDPDAGERLLGQLHKKPCLGFEKDDDALTQAVRQRLGSDDRPGGPLALPEVLTLLREQALTEAGGGLLADAWQRLARDIERVQDGLPDAATGDPAAYVAEVDKRLSPKWSAFTGEGGPIVLDGLSVRLVTPVACDAAGACAELLARMRLIRVVNLMTALQDHLQRPMLAQQLAVAQTELARWKTYRADSKHQYFWELWANGRLMANDRKLCPRDGEGGLVGFCQVPTSQLVLAHPDAGLRWSRRAGQSSELEPALVIDIVGQYFIAWQGERSARIGRQWGYTLAATYSQVEGRPEWAFGPRVFYNGYNLALTRGPGGHWGLVLNLGLADAYFTAQRKADYADPLKALNKPGFLDLLMR